MSNAYHRWLHLPWLRATSKTRNRHERPERPQCACQRLYIRRSVAQQCQNLAQWQNQRQTIAKYTRCLFEHRSYNDSLDDSTNMKFWHYVWFCLHRFNNERNEILSIESSTAIKVALAWLIFFHGIRYLSVWRTRYDRVEQSFVIVSCVPGNGISLRRRPPISWRNRRIQCSVTLIRERHTSAKSNS